MSFTETNEPPVLTVCDLSAGYRRKVVFSRVTFSVQPGELVGITGENGAGKSTLLRTLTGLVKPKSGTIDVRGALGYCPQEPTLFALLTVRENFRFFAAAYDLPDWASPMRALLHDLDFQKYENEVVARLSGGNRQKLNLALSLLHGPTVLILDEPYSAFDWQTYLKFWDLVEGLRERRCAILVVSHLVYDRTRFNRVLELVDGRLT